jgi:hypothetical protein
VPVSPPISTGRALLAMTGIGAIASRKLRALPTSGNDVICRALGSVAAAPPPIRGSIDTVFTG